MNKYIVHYAFSGMETEGRLELEEPQKFEAESKAEALYKYHCYTAFTQGRKPFHKSLSEHMKSDYKEGGWGFVVHQLHDSEVVHKLDWFEHSYEPYNK